MTNPSPKQIHIIGAGPAGLTAAETVAAAGHAVTVHDRMPSPGRKFLMAGRGGLNLTHSEPIEALLGRYGTARPHLEPAITAFPPAAVIAWCEGLGQPSFVGSSGRVFPRALKASPLLRAWLRRLDAAGVRLLTHHHWRGWADDGALRFGTPAGEAHAPADATILALGGASWPRLGADGGWTDLLPGVEIAPLRPANCGFTVLWSDIFRTRFAGTPLKRIALTFGTETVRGEAMITTSGIEGGAVYALCGPVRDALNAGPATLHVDLLPDLTSDEVVRRLALPRRGQSLGNFLRKYAGLDPVRIGLVQEALHHGADPDGLAVLLKSLPLVLHATSPIARAISTAGGIAWSEVDEHFMLHRRPGVFVAGEMLDWEAPTGGYLLQACLATGRAAGEGVRAYLAARD